MKCEEAAEFVSALCDGESIPPVQPSTLARAKPAEDA